MWAILSTLFCCLPLGIASIVFAAQVNSKYAAGDIAGAQDSSEKAASSLCGRRSSAWSSAILYILLVVVLGVAGSSLDTTTDY